MLQKTMILAACAGLLSACSLPTYQPGPSDKVARVALQKFDNPTLCVGRNPFLLNPDSSGHVIIPADRSVHMTGFYYGQGGMCIMGVVFAPKSGQVYEIVNELRAERCIASVMIRDPSAEYGLRVVPESMPAPPTCN